MKRFLITVSIFALSFCMLIAGFGGDFTPVMAQNDVLSLESKSALLMEYASGDILFEKDSQERLPVASMVKMMTILISLEEYDAGNVSLDTMITTTENASSMGGSQVFIDPYVEYRFDDLLKSVIMASANDASVALAEYFNGNETAFVNRMNKRAKELGMKNTHYSTCTGLPAPEQYSCAEDTAILLREILKHDLYHNYSTIWMDTLKHPSGRETELVNTNRLVRYYQGCDGGKTGSTNEAGCCLGASAKRDGMRLISVIIGAPNSKTRFNESAVLLNYGFGNFQSQTLVDCQTPIATLKLAKGKKDTIDAFAKENFSAVVKKGDDTNYQTKIDVKSKISAPAKNGDVVGEVVVTKQGNVVKKIPVIIKEDAKHLSLFETAREVVNKW
ncbi:MAG: D-alanyl-D-alanine carboxypeptidase [Clostridia bacterium]|nr:D-alanyl-D-alanine carboxypeptidase [Clostridia bacterium]